MRVTMTIIAAVTSCSCTRHATEVEGTITNVTSTATKIEPRRDIIIPIHLLCSPICDNTTEAIIMAQLTGFYPTLRHGFRLKTEGKRFRISYRGSRSTRQRHKNDNNRPPTNQTSSPRSGGNRCADEQKVSVDCVIRKGMSLSIYLHAALQKRAVLY
jgi:hypothetical protein